MPEAACAQRFSCMMLHCATTSQAYGYPTFYGGQQTIISTMLGRQEPHPDNNKRNQGCRNNDSSPLGPHFGGRCTPFGAHSISVNAHQDQAHCWVTCAPPQVRKHSQLKHPASTHTQALLQLQQWLQGLPVHASLPPRRTLWRHQQWRSNRCE